MKNNMIEFSSKKDSVGRRKVKIVLHEIHDNETEFNHNGITWLEQHVLNNLPSAEGIPLCCQFIDDENDVPLGHGEVSQRDGQIIIENSVVVGSVQKAYIDTVEVNGRTIKAVIGEGVVYSNRYPQFVKWMEDKINNGENVDSSVEISGLAEHENRIVYEGGYKDKGRIPKVFSYIGHAILSIPPADDSAVLLELNNKSHKEDNEMKETVVELNNKIDEQRIEINSLQDKVKAADQSVAELSEKVSTKETELNSTIEQLKEVNAKLEKKEKELEEEKKKKEELEAETNSLREYKQEIENKKMVADLNSKLSSYTDEEKSVAKDKVEQFTKEPKAELMSEIISDINSSIAQKIVAERSKQSTEMNSKAADIYSDVYEVNSDNDVSVEDLY